MSSETNQCLRDIGNGSDTVYHECAAIIAAHEHHASLWTKAFTQLLQQGYVGGWWIEGLRYTEAGLPDNGGLPGVDLRLDKFVRKVGDQKTFDYESLGIVMACAVRMADNLVDLLGFTRKSCDPNRRIAIGATGMAKVLSELNLPPSEKDTWKTSSRILRTLVLNGHRTSILLAAEKGAYPAFDSKAVLDSPEVRQLSREVREDIACFGLRNASLFRFPLFADGK